MESHCLDDVLSERVVLPETAIIIGSLKQQRVNSLQSEVSESQSQVLQTRGDVDANSNEKHIFHKKYEYTC